MNLNEQLLQSQKSRYATKVFNSTKKISKSDWSTIEESLILTPSSYGLQPWKFVVIEQEALKKELVNYSWKQQQVVDCSHFVVFLGKTSMDEPYIQRFLEIISSERSIELSTLEGYGKMMTQDLVKGTRSSMISEWAARQVYIALGNFMTSCALLHIDTCPLEGIQPTKYDEILGLKESGYQTLVACAAGYRSEEDKYQHLKKVRFQASELIMRK
jgi:nitroreductase